MPPPQDIRQKQYPLHPDTVTGYLICNIVGNLKCNYRLQFL